MSQTDSASALIEQLELAPHPEGGWCRETRRGVVAAGKVPKGLVPTGAWQAAGPSKGAFGSTPVSGLVISGFDFAGFELASSGWSHGS